MQDVNSSENRRFYIEEFEKIMAEKSKPSQETNRTLFWAYEDSIENKNESLNFDDTIWTKDIASIVESCRKNRINEFTISNTCSGLTTILEAFEEQGCKVCGLTRANKNYGRKTVPAIKLQVL